MVTGNFALLIGADPAAVHRWYLEVYVDAYEWVELPNTLGMSQFGDGGLVGSKPYVSSGAYIDRMSDYCRHCRYDVKQRIGPDACPFNALYWDFIARHEDKLAGNHRMAMPYRTWPNSRRRHGTRRGRRRRPSSTVSTAAAARITEPRLAPARACRRAARPRGTSRGRDRLARPEAVLDPLVTTEWLAAELGAREPAHRRRDAARPRAGPRRACRVRGGHIPGAVFLDLAELRDTDSPLPNMLPPIAKVASRLGRLGLGDGTRIVLYDDSPWKSAARAGG